MDMSVRMSLIIYLQPWSESMTLAPSILGISPRSPKNRVLSSSKIGSEIIVFRKNLFWEIVLCVEVTLVSRFHPS
jgi:hypothetical protein